MTTLITVRLTLRILNTTPDGDFADLTRSIKVPEVPRVGDIVYLNSLETAPREVTAREWGFDGAPTVRLATIVAKNDITPNEGADAVRTLKQDGWAIDLPVST